jgi:hypothetical protein
VAAKVVAFVPAVKVIPLEIIKLPYTDRALFPKAPAKPVKLILLKLLIVTVSDPAVIFTDIDLVDVVVAPLVKFLVPVEPAYVLLTTAMPIIVKLVSVAVFQIVPALPVRVMFPVPKSIDLMLLLLEANAVHDSVLVPKLIDPKVNVNGPRTGKLSPRDKDKVELLNATPRHVAPVAVVQVPVPDKESKNAASAEVGAEAPAAPPEVKDQLAVLEASHTPVPPTQNLLAIYYLYLR